MADRAFLRIVGFWFQLDFLVGRQPVRHVFLNGLFLNVPVGAALQLFLELPGILVNLRFGFPIDILTLAVYGKLAEPAAVSTLLGRRALPLSRRVIDSFIKAYPFT